MEYWNTITTEPYSPTALENPSATPVKSAGINGGKHAKTSAIEGSQRPGSFFNLRFHFLQHRLQRPHDEGKEINSIAIPTPQHA